METHEDVFRQAFASMGMSDEFEYGKYCAIHGIEYPRTTRFRSFQDVVQATGGMDVDMFCRGTSDNLRSEVVNHSLQMYNGSVAVITAASSVVRSVTDAMATGAERDVGLAQWLKFVHGYFVRAQTQLELSYQYLLGCAHGKLSEGKALVDHERKAVDMFLAQLDNSCATDDRLVGGSSYTALEYGDMSGAYKLRIAPEGLRSKIALRILGGNQADVVITAVAE